MSAGLANIDTGTMPKAERCTSYREVKYRGSGVFTAWAVCANGRAVRSQTQVLKPPVRQVRHTPWCLDC